jgi:hypothetical protein
MNAQSSNNFFEYLEISSRVEQINSENRLMEPNLIIQRNYEEGIERNEWGK